MRAMQGEPLCLATRFLEESKCVETGHENPRLGSGSSQEEKIQLETTRTATREDLPGTEFSTVVSSSA
jgi:hypothetical protein